MISSEGGKGAALGKFNLLGIIDIPNLQIRILII